MLLPPTSVFPISPCPPTTHPPNTLPTHTHSCTNSQKNSRSRPPPVLYVRGHELVQLAMRPQSTMGNCSDSRSGISCSLLIESCVTAWLDATEREQKGATGCHPVHRFTCTDTHARRDTFRQTEAHIQTCLNAYITANCFWKSRLYCMISMLASAACVLWKWSSYQLNCSHNYVFVANLII